MTLSPALCALRTGILAMPGNWYIHGPVPKSSRPQFTKNAPALLGFDNSINREGKTTDYQHAIGCARANFNILSLYGTKILYNLCRNFEWQLCAAKGALPGQGNKDITFAVAPKDLVISGGDSSVALGACSSCTRPWAARWVMHREISFTRKPACTMRSAQTGNHCGSSSQGSCGVATWSIRASNSLLRHSYKQKQWRHNQAERQEVRKRGDAEPEDDSGCIECLKRVI